MLFSRLSVLGVVLATLMSALTALAEPVTESWRRDPGQYAIFHTNHGRMVCVLYRKKSPVTVKNFVKLAEGKKDWTDPRTGESVTGKRFYDGLKFHRVIPRFMIQGGDPLGTGTGGPGYKFEDEWESDLRFDRPGRLAMANSGPATNGSQFFITEVATPHLNQRHTIFGQLVQGEEVLRKIAQVPVGSANRPTTDVVMEKVEIVRIYAE